MTASERAAKAPLTFNPMATLISEISNGQYCYAMRPDGSRNYRTVYVWPNWATRAIALSITRRPKMELDICHIIDFAGGES